MDRGRIIKVDTVDISEETRVDLPQNPMTQGKQKMLRAYIEYTNSSGKGHKWFDTNSEELCVPGTHVTSKRKEQFKKPKIPTPIRKICLPRNRNKLSV